MENRYCWFVECYEVHFFACNYIVWHTITLKTGKCHHDDSCLASPLFDCIPVFHASQHSTRRGKTNNSVV